MPVLTPDGGERGNGFEEDFVQAEIGEHQQQQGPADHGGDSEQRYRECLALHGRADGAVCDGDAVTAPDFIPDGETEDQKSGDLDAAGRPCAAATDEHQNIGDHEGLGGSSTVVDAVEPCRAREDSPGKAGQELPAQGHLTERLVPVPLKAREENETRGQKHEGAENRESKVDGPVP